MTIPNVARVADSFGLRSVTICTHTELEEKVRETLETPGPVVAEVFTPIELSARPKQISYKRKDGQMESLPLEYLLPEISEDEMRANMLIPLYEKS